MEGQLVEDDLEGPAGLPNNLLHHKCGVSIRVERPAKGQVRDADHSVEGLYKSNSAHLPARILRRNGGAAVVESILIIIMA